MLLKTAERCSFQPSCVISIYNTIEMLGVYNMFELMCERVVKA